MQNLRHTCILEDGGLGDGWSEVTGSNGRFGPAGGSILRSIPSAGTIFLRSCEAFKAPCCHYERPEELFGLLEEHL